MDFACVTYAKDSMHHVTLPVCSIKAAVSLLTLYPSWTHPLGILPSSQGFLAAGFKMDLKGFKIKSTWTLFICNTNFEACVQKQEDRHALQEYCFVQNANILLPALTAPLPYTVSFWEGGYLYIWKTVSLWSLQ